MSAVEKANGLPNIKAYLRGEYPRPKEPLAPAPVEPIPAESAEEGGPIGEPSDLGLGITAGIWLVTPEIAAAWLDTNARNRRVSPTSRKKYAAEMKARRWRLNGETVVIGEDGGLMDGQHRLHGCVDSGEPFLTIVVEGVRGDTFDTLDTGRARQGADVLSIKGFTNTSMAAGLAGFLWQYENGHAASSVRPSNAEILRLVESNPEVVEHATAATSFWAPCRNATFALASLLFARVDREARDRFFHMLTTGESIPARHPVLALRRRLEENYTKKAKLPRHLILALAIIAWNHYRRGTAVNYLVHRDGEPMPKPI